MTTIGTSDGRSYARINLRLTERSARDRSQKEIERAIRTKLKPIPESRLIGYNRPVPGQPAGPDPDTLTSLISRSPPKSPRSGIADPRFPKRHAILRFPFV
jgi:hypothetical protein